MSYSATVINIMIASPGDVASEREAIQAIIHNWNSLHAEHRQTVLMPIMWETHATPEMGDRAQAIINRQVLDNCDVLVAVFWTRLGSPTGDAPSGTVEEIRKHLAAGKPALIYFSNRPVDPDSIDPEQYNALKEFRAECEEKGLIFRYDGLEQFRDACSRHLEKTVRERFPGPQPADSATAAPTPTQVAPKLSDQAKLLLVTAAEADGSVLRIRVLGGTIIQAGHSQMAKMGDKRDEARWDAALRELVDHGYLEPRGHKDEVFTVTHKGYTFAERLKPQLHS